MQVTMDDAQRKRRGANKSGGRWGDRLFMGNQLVQFDLIVGWKITECVMTRLLPNTKFCADEWHIYSDTPGTLRFMCLKYLVDVIRTKENKFGY